MRSAGIVWTAETLDRFLRAPLEMLPETTMTYDGIADPQERADLIAFLVKAGSDPTPDSLCHQGEAPAAFGPGTRYRVC